ncbi:MAG: hypothetical protein QF449_14010 [Alphaproteobacteria bacterium]|nr:hypothetical protein [Rhodospirillaceae bacterium]MDP6430412.1 hypothetical protein [Rhodospirillales bacterium]MDP6642687.1 hypothetical protein [Rhodospirillales bacterium]MDP6819138.1 hypothetical protein [Alphaproteobacteria bacterium]
MKKYLTLSIIALTVLNLVTFPGTSSARAAETENARHLAGVCGADIQFPQNKEELSKFDVEHALRQHFTRAGVSLARVESSRAGEDVITARVYLKDGPLFWSVRVDAAEARIIASRYHLRPVGFGAGGFGAAGGLSGVHGLKREISDTQRLRRHMLGDGQPWGDWVAGIKSTCADDYRHGAPEIF